VSSKVFSAAPGPSAKRPQPGSVWPYAYLHADAIWALKQPATGLFLILAIGGWWIQAQVLGLTLDSGRERLIALWDWIWCVLVAATAILVGRLASRRSVTDVLSGPQEVALHIVAVALLALVPAAGVLAIGYGSLPREDEGFEVAQLLALWVGVAWCGVLGALCLRLSRSSRYAVGTFLLAAWLIPATLPPFADHSAAPALNSRLLLTAMAVQERSTWNIPLAAALTALGMLLLVFSLPRPQSTHPERG